MKAGALRNTKLNKEEYSAKGKVRASLEAKPPLSKKIEYGSIIA